MVWGSCCCIDMEGWEGRCCRSQERVFEVRLPPPFPGTDTEPFAYYSYSYEPAAVVVGEIDGLRIISSTTCELVQKVPGEKIYLK